MPLEGVLWVHHRPADADPERFENRLVVVVDLIRATTTICYALAAGAQGVLPVQSVEEAQAEFAQRDPSSTLLGGERGGWRVPGFHLGNSPREYHPQQVAGRTVIFTTTNGTRAMLLGLRAARVLLASFVNFSVVVEQMRKELCRQGEVHVLCAGVEGQEALEDTLMAGALVQGCVAQGQWPDHWPACTRWALAAWEQAAREALGRAGLWPWQPADSQALAEFLAQATPGGARLKAVGLAHDLPWCTRLDHLQVLPCMIPRNGLLIRPA